MSNALEAFVTNLGMYNEGLLVGKWIKLPATEEELASALEEIYIGSKNEFGLEYEEWYVTDYSCDLPGVFTAVYDKLGEYPGPARMNAAGEICESLNECGSVEDLLDYCEENGLTESAEALSETETYAEARQLMGMMFSEAMDQVIVRGF